MIGRLFAAIARAYRIRRDPVAWARSIGVVVGDRCRLLGLSGETFGSEPYLIRLGDHVTVTAGVRFITHDGGVWIYRDEHPDVDLTLPIVIGNNVFIGLNSIILPGARVGDDCVIGAGSIVKGEIAPGTIAAGVPAKPIKSKDAYWAGIEGQLDFVRSKSEAERRQYWRTKFADVLGVSDDE